jgi:hypothetical protein
VAEPALELFDDDGTRMLLDTDEAATLFGLTANLEAATVSACPTCRSRILAVVALTDLLADAPPFVRGAELGELAEEAPTLHLYVRDLTSACRHPRWRDPGFEEWADAIADLVEGPSAVY